MFGYLCKKHQAKKITDAINTKFYSLFQDLKIKGMKSLACPQLALGQSTHDVRGIIQQWGEQNQAIGFSDLPTALINYVLNLGVPVLLENIGNKDSLVQLNDLIISLFKQPDVANQRLFQDGKTWHFTIHNGGINPQKLKQSAELVLDEEGCLTLDQISINQI